MYAQDINLNGYESRHAVVETV